MRLLYHREFEKEAQDLPVATRRKLERLLPIIVENPFHSLLHTKPLTGDLRGKYSFRITRDWRVSFVFLEEDVVYLLSVKHRKDIYR